MDASPAAKLLSHLRKLQLNKKRKSDSSMQRTCSRLLGRKRMSGALTNCLSCFSFLLVLPYASLSVCMSCLKHIIRSHDSLNGRSPTGYFKHVLHSLFFSFTFHAGAETDQITTAILSRKSRTHIEMHKNEVQRDFSSLLCSRQAVRTCGWLIKSSHHRCPSLSAFFFMQPLFQLFT
mmetsp:Transcript_22404/g.44388  ORF Transcript_22404/g.44388 Transcript_22404/m.44388 type:complete len:177 (-) Transcript_22404:598-1128(-)